jgi:hypothetical protein
LKGKKDMRNAFNEFKLYRAIGLKEWGYHDESFALMTEVVLEEVDHMDVKAIQATKKDKEYVDAERYWDDYHYKQWSARPAPRPTQGHPAKGLGSGNAGAVVVSLSDGLPF